MTYVKMVVVAVPTRKTSSRTILLSVFAADRDAEWHGYALMRALGWPSGKLYPLLAALEADGALTAREGAPTGPGRPPRTLYRLTDHGAGRAQEPLDAART
jgi:DNA-binding PadR family transcriptional regulator